MNSKNVILKYTLLMPHALTNWLEYDMPEGARILAVQEQYNKPCIWSLSRAGESKKTRRFFRAMTTGNIFKGDLDELDYLDTVKLDGGGFVVHVFEKKVK